MNIPRSAFAAPLGTPGRAAGNGGMPVQGGGGLDGSGVNVGAKSTAVLVQKVERLPYWNLDGETNLMVTGWAKMPDRVIFFLSNGRELPASEVLAANDFFVSLRGGGMLRVAGVHDWEKTQRDEFGERTGQSERWGFLGRDASGVRSPAAVMSQDEGRLVRLGRVQLPVPASPAELGTSP